MINILDVILLNIVSYCSGVLSAFLFVFCCESKRFERIAKNNYLDNTMNHQRIVYPPQAPICSPVLASAPPPEDKVIQLTLK